MARAAVVPLPLLVERVHLHAPPRVAHRAHDRARGPRRAEPTTPRSRRGGRPHCRRRVVLVVAVAEAVRMARAGAPRLCSSSLGATVRCVPGMLPGSLSLAPSLAPSLPASCLRHRRRRAAASRAPSVRRRRRRRLRSPPPCFAARSPEARPPARERPHPASPRFSRRGTAPRASPERA